MNLPDEAIEEFCTAWKASFDEQITKEVAAMEASSLLEIFSLLNSALIKK